jgi:lipopolysaccharide transport system permease protein
VRYKQTALGVIWVLLQPLVASGVFAVVLRTLGAQKDVRPIDSLIFFMAALAPWSSFAMAVQNAAMSMEMNANMISKVYFPRMVIPGAYVCGAALDFLIAFAALFGIAAFAGAFRPALIAAMPLLLVVQMMAAMGLGLFFGALNAQYHDVKYVVPFLLQIGMFVSAFITLEGRSPVVRRILSLNPMASVIETYRALLAGRGVNYALLGEGAGIALFLFVGGLLFFRAREAKLVDIL